MMNYLAKYRREVASLMTTAQKILEGCEGDWCIPEAQKEDLTWILAKVKFHLKEAFKDIQEIEIEEDS